MKQGGVLMPFLVRRLIVDVLVGLAACAVMLSGTVPASLAAARPGSRPVVNGIHMITPTWGWATTQQSILRTNDGGNRWSRSLWLRRGGLNGTSSLSSLGVRWAWVAVPNSRQSAVVVYRTYNSGGRWNSVARIHVSDGLGLAGAVTVDFVDPSHGWLLLHGGCGAGSCAHEILRTTNGGATWTRVEWNYLNHSSRSALPGCNAATDHMQFMNRTLGWVTGICGAAPQLTEVYKTRDGGHTWRMQQHLLSARGIVRHVTYFNPGLPSAFTGSGCSVLPADIASPPTFELLSTCNRGVTWVPTKPIRAGHGQFGPNAAYDVLSFYYAWARVKGKLYRATSSMHGWKLVSRHPNLGVDPQIDFVNPNVGFVAQTTGASHILVTYDSGRTWTSRRT
jgi:photosystem II stability/assembly factor-like uncharacterized protein